MKSTTEETTMTASPEHDHAVEIDTAIAEVYGEMQTVSAKLDRAETSLLRTAGARQYKNASRRIAWNMEIADAEAIVEQAIADHDGEFSVVIGGMWRGLDEMKNSISRLADARQARDEVVARYRELEAQYTGWSRFFLVNNTGGHIHSSMNCSTCRFDTSFSWLPTLSGLTEAEAVAEHGAILCTVCFPSAPVEWTNQYELEAAAKAADKCPGSGTYDHNSSGLDYYSPRAECNHCGHTISATSTGKLRSHKPNGRTR